jgi:dsDNA-binding SOS-regulon protein
VDQSVSPTLKEQQAMTEQKKIEISVWIINNQDDLVRILKWKYEKDPVHLNLIDDFHMNDKKN